MAFDKSQFYAGFAADTKEMINTISNGLLAIEKNPDDKKTHDEIFRAAHTIKGSARMLGFRPITTVAHKLEDILGGLGKGELQGSKQLFGVMFKALDVISEMTEPAGIGAEITTDSQPICEELEKALAGKTVDAQEKPAKAKPQAEKKIPPKEEEKKSNEVDKKKQEKKVVEEKPPSPQKNAKPKTKTVDFIRVDSAKLDEAIRLMGELVSGQQKQKQSVLNLEELEKNSRLNFLELKNLNEKNGNGSGKIMERAGEITGAITDILADAKDTLNYQSVLEDELRDKVLKLRMVPIGSILNTFPRLVRDVSDAVGKEVELIIEGEETELDKKIVENIKDPLLHMLRNCVDHGIEKADERKKNNKPERGTVKISAGYDGGSVLVIISDDGAGINTKRVKAKALENGICTQNELDAMSELEVNSLIFRAGFSTNEIITDISGRGVGMDVVKENIIGQLKGSINIKSAEGKGTTFYIRLPLTLAVMRVLIFSVADFHYGISVNSIEEIINVTANDIIDVVGKRAIRLRDQFIPVVELKTILGLPATQKVKSDTILVLILSIGDEKLGIVIDELVDEDDIEVKPLPTHMKNIELVSGATISGKNEIIILLNIAKVIDAAKRIKGGKLEAKLKAKDKMKTKILIVEDSFSTREIERSILESYGFNVDVAENGAIALKKVAKEQYGLIVTDIEMPELDGFSLTEKLREMPEYEHIPIVIVSSRDNEEDKRRGIEVGADAYIIKGEFEQSNLVETIQCLIN